MPTTFYFNRLTETLRTLTNRVTTLERYAASGEFIEYTPRLTATVTNPNLDVYDAVSNPTGTGSINGKYMRIGNLVYVLGDLVFGAASTAGNGNYRISLPTTVVDIKTAGGPSPALTYTVMGHWRMTGFGMAEFNDIQAVGNTNYMTCRYPNAWPVGTETIVAYNNPWAWAATYRISFFVLYEAKV